MNESIYELYCNTKNLIEEAPEDLDDNDMNYVQDLKLSIVIFEENSPDYKQRYEYEHE